MRLLIVRLSAFGDIVHTLPLALNARQAGAQVGWLCESRYRDLLEGNPNIDRLFFADTRAWRRRPFSSQSRAAFRGLRAELSDFAPDHTIDVQGLWKSAVLARLARAPVVGFAASQRRESASALLCPIRVHPPAEARHVVDRNLALLSAVGVPALLRAPDATYLLSRESPEATAFLAAQPRPYAVYHPGAGRPEKVWGPEKLADVARRLDGSAGLHAVLSWGPGDEAEAERMSRLLPGARRVPLLAPHGLAHVIAGAEIFVGGDTGPLHLADALGARTLALFGPTDPARNGPYRGASLRYEGGTTPETVAAHALEVLAEPGGSRLRRPVS
jgi:lipopolysaccharide heptosyltransferase I